MSELSGSRPSTVCNDWRAKIRRDQREVLRDGRTVLSGTGPYGGGGLGRHLAEMAEALRDNGLLTRYLSPRARPGDGAGVQVEIPQAIQTLMGLPPFRFSPGWRTYLGYAGFDAAAAHKLSRADRLLAFNGAALRQLRAARRLGYREVGLVSANGHLVNVARQHEKAFRRYPIERPWGPRSVSRNRAEYEMADLIYVPSMYVWNTFTREGYPADRLRLFRLTPDDRFQPRQSEPTVSTFNIVYTGSLSVHKGVPLLIDCVRRLPYEDLRLILVGGYGSRAMRQFVETARASDARIAALPGDPLPHLLQASVYVHPSYEEGCTYAPAEAAACGVPLILTEDSAMVTEYVPNLTCRIVPTGAPDAMTQAIEAAYRGDWSH